MSKFPPLKRTLSATARNVTHAYAFLLGIAAYKTPYTRSVYNRGADAIAAVAKRIRPGYEEGMIRRELLAYAASKRIEDPARINDRELSLYRKVFASLSFLAVFSWVPPIFAVTVLSILACHTRFRAISPQGSYSYPKEMFNLGLHKDYSMAFAFRRYVHREEGYKNISKTLAHIDEIRFPVMKGLFIPLLFLAHFAVFFSTKRLLSDYYIQAEFGIFFGGFLAQCGEVFYKNEASDYFTSFYKAKAKTLAASNNVPDMALIMYFILATLRRIL